MIIGMMTNFNTPTKLARHTALISKFYGIDVVYMRPKDVDITKGTINAKFFKDNKWVKEEIDIPPFIDIVPYCFLNKNKEVTDFLKENTFLSDNRENILTKQALQRHLEKDNKYSGLVIPTHEYTTFETMFELLETYQKIVLKPSGGIQGKRIYVLEKRENAYILGHNTKEQVLNKEELEQFFNDNIARKDYLIQKFVFSRARDGNPFDCRIHVEKNYKGKWQSAKNYIRIGIGQTVISNVNQGGGVATPSKFLKANFEEEMAEEILGKLDTLAITLPYKVEKLRGTHIMSLGLDVGIDRDGSLHLFEINDGPTTRGLVSEVAYLRSNYYKFILKEKLDIFKEAPNIDYEEYIRLLRERDFYKNEYTKVKTSTSWKITSPIRIVGSLKKKITKK